MPDGIASSLLFFPSRLAQLDEVVICPPGRLAAKDAICAWSGGSDEPLKKKKKNKGKTATDNFLLTNQ